MCCDGKRTQSNKQEQAQGIKMWLNIISLIGHLANQNENQKSE